MFKFGNRMLTITTTELQNRLDRGERLTIIDVREPGEYAEGHIPGSSLHPLGQIQSWVQLFDKNQELFLICRTGNRSGTAYQFLENMGFTNLRNITGGMTAWRGSVER